MLARITHTLLRGKRFAVPLTVLVSLLPVLNWFAWVMMAFVTIRRGWRASWPVLLAVVFPQILLNSMMFHNVLMASQILVAGLLLWVAALCWHKMRSWVLVLEANLLFGSAVILLTHCLMPEIAHMWQQLYTHYWQGWSQELAANSWWQDYGASMLLTLQNNPKVLITLSHIATGVSVAAMLLASLLQLLLAQYWEQRFFNNQQWRQQLKAIRLSRSVGFMYMVLLVIAVAGVVIVQDLLPLWCMIFAIAGLSLFHAKLTRSKRASWHYRMRLIAVYTLMVLLLVYAFLGLVLLGVFDSALNLRSRWLGQQLKRV